MAEATVQSMAEAPTAKNAGFLDVVRKVRNEKTGLLPFAIVVVLCAIFVIPLYNYLGLPALYLSNLFLSVDCANNSWICGTWLALLASSGPIVIGVLLLVFRNQVRSLLGKTKALMETDFLLLPILATLFFTIGWSGIAFHFFDREGFVLDGHFPIVFGALVFALGRWGGAVKEHGAALFAPREKIPQKFRILALFGTILLLGWILAPIHAPQRDQLVAALSLLLGWWMFTLLPNAAAPPKPATAPTSALAWLPLAILGLIASLAERVLAQPCVHDTKLDYFDCEQAHHNGTAAAGSGTVAVLAAGGIAGPLAGSTAKPTTIQEQMAEDARKQQMERWKIMQETQTKIFEQQQEVTVNKAKTADKAFEKMDEYIRDDAPKPQESDPPAPPPGSTAAVDQRIGQILDQIRALASTRDPDARTVAQIEELQHQLDQLKALRATLGGADGPKYDWDQR